MSGVIETAGLVIAVLPLLISVFENYKVTIQPISTYCRYDKEFRDFRIVFATQKQLFESHCLFLLSRIDAEWVLEEPSRRSESVKQNEEAKAADIRIMDYLGSSVRTCIQIIELIDRTLLSIAKETKCLKEAASQVSRFILAVRCVPLPLLPYGCMIFYKSRSASIAGQLSSVRTLRLEPKLVPHPHGRRSNSASPSLI